MDPGPMTMAGDFGAMNPEPPQGFLPQAPPPPEAQLLSQRASPEFMSSQGEYFQLNHRLRTPYWHRTKIIGIAWTHRLGIRCFSVLKMFKYRKFPPEKSAN